MKLNSFPPRNSPPASARVISSLNTVPEPSENVPLTLTDFAGPLVHTVTVTKNGLPVRIHGISTGTVAVKRAFRQAKGGRLFRKVNLLLDPVFTEMMPVWVWVIEHPEGVIVVDTGETAQVLEPAYFDRTGLFNSYLNHKTIRFALRREQEIDRQLLGLGIGLERIRSVVLTHLHLDHTDGLKYFPGIEIVVNRAEFKHPYNNLPQLYPPWFKPRLVDYRSESVAVFGESVALTEAGDVRLVATPGHTHHHSSVLFEADNAHYLFAGDASYTQDQVVAGQLAGVNANQKLTRLTYERIRAYAAQWPLVYLPSHDPESGNRLRLGQLFQPEFG
jgi:N-acyl homoserine lactone hydrolase